MSKKAKILIILFIVFLALVLYLILSSAPENKPSNPSQPVKSVSTALSDDSYKAKVKEIFTVYEKLVSDNNFTVTKIEELKNQLLSIKGLPVQFQSLHLNLILALDRLENYLKNKDEQEKTASRQMTDKLKVDYNWLSN